MNVSLSTHRKLAACAVSLSVACVVLAAGAAEPVRMHGSAALAHAVGAPQERELGFGGLAHLGLELPLSPVFGVQAGLSGLFLADGQPPRDPRFVDRSAGLSGFVMAGVRVQMPRGGPWADVDLGLAATGGARFAFDTHAGWDFVVDRRRAWRAGPMVGYFHVVQPDDALRPEDAHVFVIGAHVSYGKANASGPCPDADRDGVCDDRDVCPEVAGRRTDDPKTDGCPRLDRDNDSVFDDEDACPEVAGRRTEDPKTNGCPRGDRDHDTIFDDEDACPDQPGIASDDPKKHGCPRPDRDNDTVFDDEDACPDVPGVRSADPKANGCPAAAGPIRVEGDRIVLDEVIRFENNSPRVRRGSWALVAKVATYINANADILEIDIEGHADRLGSNEHNLRLSKERAEAVRRLLVKFGVSSARVSARGFGEGRPISQRRTLSAPQDRRVEFWVVKARPAQSAPGAGAKP